MTGSCEMSRSWKPNVVVAAVIERDGRFLMVEEETTDGLRINQPAGHLEANESLLQAAVRETFEETAHHFVPECLVGIYQWQRPRTDVTYVRFTFAGEVWEPKESVELDSGIVRTLWLSERELRDSVSRLRSPLVLQSVEDWLRGQRFGLELLGS